jgi:hypothetical protein
MELIPILSTIILIATISTFLLAIGAYILYKVRERKGQVATTPHQAETRAEVVTPAGLPAPRQMEQQRAAPQPMLLQQQAQVPQKPFSQRPQAYTVYDGARPRQFNETGYVQQRGLQTPPSYGVQPEETRQHGDTKFLKYTSEGYVSAKENKESGAVRWR